MSVSQISKIRLPSGQTYYLKDEEARSQIQALVGLDAVKFIGISTTKLTDGGSETPTIEGEQVTPSVGQLCFYGIEQFIWGPDNTWHALGGLNTLGNLAHKDAATGNFTPSGSVTTSTATTENKTAAVSVQSGVATYTPAGSVSAPTISVKTAGSTETIKNPTAETVVKTVIATVPGGTSPSNSVTYYSVENETLNLYQLGYTTGDSITTNNVTVKTGDAAYQASAPNFSGTGVRLVTDDIAIPKTYNSTFSGTEDLVTVS